MKAKRVGAMALLLALVLSLVGCGKSLEKQLVGSWYLEGRNKPNFILYDDGTCNIPNEYGHGTWAVVNDNQLKLTTFYGETAVMTIESLENGCLKGTDSHGNTGTLWNTPQGKD